MLATDCTFAWVLKKQGRGFIEALHPRDARGQFSYSHSPSDALESLVNGEPVSVAREDVREFLERAAKRIDDPNLIKVHVEGTPIFDKFNLGIPRSKMPQIPKNLREQFLESVEAVGVKVTSESVDPMLLHPSQMEVSARAVGVRLLEHEQDARKTFGAVIVSKDGFVMDGHHHWALMAAVALDHPSAKLPIRRLHVDHARALMMMHAFARRRGIASRELKAALDTAHEILKSMALKGGPGSGRYPKGSGHQKESGEPRHFTSEEGYQWHEQGPGLEWARGLPLADHRALGSYASFGYHEVNEYMRGLYKPRMINEFVRAATPAEAAEKFQVTPEYLAKFPHPFGRSDTDWKPEDPYHRVLDAEGNYVGHVVHNVFYTDPATKETVPYSVQRTVPDIARVEELKQQAARLDDLIANRGLVLPEDIVVERGAYLPGVTFEQLQSMAYEGPNGEPPAVYEEKGFTSTMLGDANGRARSYPALGKSESLYNRYTNKMHEHENEEGSAVRFHITLPAGTKVADIETSRRLEFDHPKIPNPEPIPQNDEFWTKNPHLWTTTLYDEVSKVREEQLADKQTRSESEILLGSGARFRVNHVQHGDTYPGGGGMAPIPIVEVHLEYIGGGSSDGRVVKKGGPGSGRYPKGSGVANAMLALASKYPVVATNYVKSSGTEMGSIAAHTNDVGVTWNKQITPAELAGISGRWGSDVGHLMDHVIALHDIGKAIAIEERGDIHQQHAETAPILKDVLTKEGFRAEDIALALTLTDHDLIGGLVSDAYVPGRINSPETVATHLQAKADAIGMSVSDFATLQMAFFMADAGAYPYVKNNFMKEDASGKLLMKQAEKLAPIHMLMRGSVQKWACVLKGGPGSGRYPKGSGEHPRAFGRTRSGPPATSVVEAKARGYTEGPFYHSTDFAREIAKHGVLSKGAEPYEMNDTGSLEDFRKWGTASPFMFSPNRDDVIETEAHNSYGKDVITVYVKPGAVKDAAGLTLNGGFYVSDPSQVIPIKGSIRSAKKLTAATALKFDEGQHPRDAEGKFTESVQSSATAIYYHGTTSDVIAEIQRDGLMAEAERVGAQNWHRTYTTAIYLTPDKVLATKYASQRSITRDSNAILLEVQVPADQAHRLASTYDNRAVVFPERIPPEWIKNVEVLNSGTSHGVKVAVALNDGNMDHIFYAVVIVTEDIDEMVLKGGPGSGRYPKGSGVQSSATGEGGKIYHKPSDIVKVKGWGEEYSYQWVEPDGKPAGHLLTGEPIAHADLPQVMYHVTTNAPAVEASGLLRGQNKDAGLGGGQSEGVSLTLSQEDATTIERELTRAVEIARGEVGIEALTRYAREDERSAGLPEHSLDYAVQAGQQMWDGNITAGAEGSKIYETDVAKRSLVKDAFNSYLWGRETVSEKAAGQKVPSLKNPILFGRQEHLAKINPGDIKILEVQAIDVPKDALITTGSDKFLHEVRVFADVPRRRRKSEYQCVLKGGPGSGRYPKGSGGLVTPGPVETRLRAAWDTTENPLETGFLLSDGTRIKKSAHISHAAMATGPMGLSESELGKYVSGGELKALFELLDEGAIRYVPKEGVYLSRPPSETAARVIIDDWKFYFPETPLRVDYVEPGTEGRGAAYKAFDINSVTVDALRNWVKGQHGRKAASEYMFALKGGPGSGRYPKGSGGHNEIKTVDEQGVTHVGDFVEFYHGTSSLRAKKILKEGLRIRAVGKQTMGGDSEGNRDYIWLAKRPGSATLYSEMHAHPSVVTIRIPSKVYELMNRHDRDSGPDSVWVRQEIPPKYVHSVSKLDVASVLKGGPGSGRYPKGSGHHHGQTEEALSGIDVVPRQNVKASIRRPAGGFETPPSEYEEMINAEAVKWLKDRIDEVTLYHGTTLEALESIKKNGLVPGKERGGDAYAESQGLVDLSGGRGASVYITPMASYALQFANLVHDVRGGEPVVLKINVKDTEHLKADERSEPGTAYRLEQIIPPSWISEYATVAPNGRPEWHTFKRELGVFYMVIACDTPMLSKATQVLKGGPGSGRYPKGSGAHPHQFMSTIGIPGPIPGVRAHRKVPYMGIPKEHLKTGELGIINNIYATALYAENTPHGTGFANTPKAIGTVEGKPRFENNPLMQAIAPKKIKSQLLGPVTEAMGGSLEGGVNKSMLVDLADGSQAIYKPEIGEQWGLGFVNHDIPRYITNHELSLAEREAMAYEVDQALGLNLVPETVLRPELDIEVDLSSYDSGSGDGGGWDADELQHMYEDYKEKNQEQAYEAAAEEMQRLFEGAQKEHVQNYENRAEEVQELWDEVLVDHPLDEEIYGSRTMQGKHPTLPMGTKPEFRRGMDSKEVDPVAVLDEAKVNVEGSLTEKERDTVKAILTRMRVEEGYISLGGVDEVAARDNLTYSSWLEDHADTEGQLVDQNIVSFTNWREQNGYEIGNSGGGGGSRQENTEAPHPKGGSLQKFVDGLTHYGDPSDEDLEKYAVLDYALGTMDRHGGNAMFAEDGRSVAIDNGYSMPGSKTPDGFQFRSGPVVMWRGREYRSEKPHTLSIREQMTLALKQTDWKSFVARHPGMSQAEKLAFLGRIDKLETAMKTPDGLFELWGRQKLT